jgi:hypothetical protein
VNALQVYQTYAMSMLMMPCSSFSYSNTRGVTTHRVRAAPEGAPDSEQYLFDAAPDCPVPHEVRAPTVETIRTLTVG